MAQNDAGDDKKKAIEGGDRTFVAAWLEAIEASGPDNGEERDWFKEAEQALKAYRGDKDSHTRSFNIYHSNTETLVPSLYSSTPIPDVRRRYNDSDKVAGEVCEILERAISYSIDAYDFDRLMLSCTKDMAIVDRGCARVRYIPTLDKAGEEVVYEEVRCEYVPWRSFRRGPARVWEDVPWIAFEHFLSKEQVKKLNPDLAEDVPYTYSASAKSEKDDKDNTTVPKFGARAHVWEIWDKDTRTVVFIAAEYAEKPLKIEEDPLGLEEFFPFPRPMQALGTTDTLVPVTSYSIYSDLIAELNTVTERIRKLTSALRARGWYIGTQGVSFEAVVNADDGELVPLEGAETFAATGGGLDKAISWMPLEPIAESIKQLSERQEQIKATIYEVTGISDIIRGASNPNETATAQQIKTQWGSLRVQRMQSEVARFARDLFRLKAEIIGSKFEWQTLAQMTGLEYPSKAEQQAAQQQMEAGQQAIQAGQLDPNDPQIAQMAAQLEQILDKCAHEDVEGLLRDEGTRGFRIDIESDSTIRGDLARNQEQMKGFLEGTAQFAQSVGPLVAEGGMPPDIAIEVFSAFSRSFRLGKQAEDALDRWADEARKARENPGPSNDPAAEAAQAEAQAKSDEVKIKKQVADKDGEEKDRRFALDKEKQDFEIKVGRFEVQAQRAELHGANEDRIHARQQHADAMHAQAQDRHVKIGDRDAKMQGEAAKLDDGRQARAEEHQLTREQMAQDGASQEADRGQAYDQMALDENARVEEAAMAEMARREEAQRAEVEGKRQRDHEFRVAKAKAKPPAKKVKK